MAFMLRSFMLIGVLMAGWTALVQMAVI